VGNPNSSNSTRVRNQFTEQRVVNGKLARWDVSIRPRFRPAEEDSNFVGWLGTTEPVLRAHEIPESSWGDAVLSFLPAKFREPMHSALSAHLQSVSPDWIVLRTEMIQAYGTYCYISSRARLKNCHFVIIVIPVSPR
jgi:hypothetical protein